MTIGPPEAVVDAIAPGETAKWWGAPPGGLRFRRSDALFVPFSLMWGGFAIFWETMALGSVASGAPGFLALWGVPFVCIGLYMIVGRFITDAYLRSRTAYAVTDRAAYIIRGGPFPTTRRYGGNALAAVTLERGNRGSGTLRFVPAPSAVSMFGNRSAFPGATVPDAFEWIDDLQHVYELVAEASTAGATAQP